MVKTAEISNSFDPFLAFCLWHSRRKAHRRSPPPCRQHRCLPDGSGFGPDGSDDRSAQSNQTREHGNDGNDIVAGCRAQPKGDAPQQHDVQCKDGYLSARVVVDIASSYFGCPFDILVGVGVAAAAGRVKQTPKAASMQTGMHVDDFLVGSAGRGKTCIAPRRRLRIG